MRLGRSRKSLAQSEVRESFNQCNSFIEPEVASNTQVDVLPAGQVPFQYRGVVMEEVLTYNRLVSFQYHIFYLHLSFICALDFISCHPLSQLSPPTVADPRSLLLDDVCFFQFSIQKKKEKPLVCLLGTRWQLRKKCVFVVCKQKMERTQKNMEKTA